MLDKILDFIREAGDFALGNQSKIDFATSKLKSAKNSDVVTTTDLEISRRFAKFVHDNFAKLDYVIVDEESVANLGENPMAEIKKHEFAFIIDPIDGTLCYANHLPYFGISIGVFRGGKPYCGAVFCPALRLLTYADEKNAFIEENGNQRKLETIRETASLYANSFYDAVKENRQLSKRLNVSALSLYSAVVNATYVATGQLRCYGSQCYLWDVAGMYPVFAKIGVEIFNATTGKKEDLFSEETFTEKLKFREPFIVCAPKYLADFRELFELS